MLYRIYGPLQHCIGLAVYFACPELMYAVDNNSAYPCQAPVFCCVNKYEAISCRDDRLRFVGFFTQVRTFRADLSCTVAAGVVPCTGPVVGDILTGSSLTFDSKESSVPSYAPALTIYHK